MTTTRQDACRHCGTPIAGSPHVRDADGYCCEACFLAERKQRVSGADGDAHTALTEALVCALDAREHESGMHSKRVACHTLVLARHFTADPDILQQVYWGALLHDIGKIGIPDAILLKQGSLTESEWHIMRSHSEIGHRILSTAPFMCEAAQIVLYHEERFDGTGYPRGMKGAAIPLWARLFAVIDTLDAMTSERPYRKALTFEVARDDIVAQAGRQFDPNVVDIFIAEETTLREMVELKCNAGSQTNYLSPGLGVWPYPTSSSRI